MKKYLCLTLAAAALLLPQQAFAWKNIQFGVGLNFSYSSGNNAFGIGKHQLWYNGPGPMDGMGYHGHAPMYFDHHPVQTTEPVQATPAPSTKSDSAQNTFSNPFQYSSYSGSGYYYQQPSYAQPEPFQYYGQDHWYGW